LLCVAELLTPIVVFELVAGLFFPRVAVVAGVFTIIGRQLFAIGYRSKGIVSDMIHITHSPPASQLFSCSHTTLAFVVCVSRRSWTSGGRHHH
jgi:hypothetical protein